MESAIANVELGKYRRIVQMFWDPEPTNDPTIDRPVWCLGRSYTLAEQACGNPKVEQRTSHHDALIDKSRSGTNGVTISSSSSKNLFGSRESSKTSSILPADPPHTPPESVSSSFSSSLAFEENNTQSGWPQAFIDDFRSRFWMTYRSQFEVIPKSTDPRANSVLSFSMRIKSQLGDQAGFSSDSGWGCMIRSGQSLLANAMGMVRLGRDWHSGQMGHAEREIISLFADNPAAPYSIHNFVSHGAKYCNIFPGEWFGPSATARCIQALTNDHETSLRVYSTGDGPDVFEESFLKIAQPKGETFHPTLVLVGTRLGIDKVTEVYWEALIAALQLPQSVGIAGGRPSSSHYFVGTQGEYLFYLDPHHTRKAIPHYRDVSEYSDEDVASYHTTRLRKIHIREMDPSMLIGFLIRDRDDFDDWRRSVKHVQGKSIIHISDRDPRLQGDDEIQDAAIYQVEALNDEDDIDTTQND